MAGTLLALLLAQSFACVLLEAEGRPNILIIDTDDPGYGDTSCLDPRARFRTPNLDRLAAERIAFTNARSPDTVGTPFLRHSRVSRSRHGLHE